MDHHRGMLWALVGKDVGTDFIHIHKAVRKFVKESRYDRLEMTIDSTFPEAKRWAEMLGFKMEGLMHHYYPNGADAYLYARIK